MHPLPPYARRVEFLESTGTQWIDTGFIPTATTRMETTGLFSPERDPVVFTRFGSRYSANQSCFAFNSNGTDGNLRFDLGTASTATGTQWQAGVDTATKVIIDANTKYAAYVTDVGTLVEHTFTSNMTFTNALPLTVFVFNANPLTSAAWQMQVSSLRIWDNENLVRGFVPCRILDTGYLWDEVEGKFYGNSGTGSFVLGPDVREGVVPTRLNPFGVGRRMSDVPYFEDGAVMILDGIFNVGVGRHSSESSTTSWKDLVGGHDATLTRASNGWTENSLNTKILTGGTASTVAAGAFPGIPFAENTTVEMVFRVDQAQNANGEVIVFAGGHGRFGFSFVSGGTAGNLIIATTPDTRVAVDMSDSDVDPDICDLGKVHHFCVVFGESDSLTGWSLYHNGSGQPLYIRGGNVGLQSDGTGTIVGRTNSVTVPNNANGQILAFRVYNRALTQAEISNHWLVDRDRFGIGKIVQ